jgi:sigma-B regulation protein RsbU (phosphoserine phosphatase)
MSLSGAEPAVAVDDLFEVAPCGYVVLEDNGTIQRANAEFLRLVDTPANEVVGRRTLSSLVSTGGRILLETHVRPILAHAGEVREIALELVRPDGGRVPVLLNARRLDAETRSVVVVLLEMRDRHRYEDYLLGAARAAERAGEDAASMAATLQQTLIPPEPPAIPHLEIDAAYRPAGSGREVGGDFYDVFQVGPEAWMVVLGDVSGKGIPAAVITSFVRHTLRSLAIAHPDPSDLLRALDTAMRTHGTDHHCTVVAVRLERTDTRWTLALSLAGHPPALVRRPNGHAYELGLPGTPAGLMSDPHFHTVRHELGDEVVTLYTDGVTEARSSTGELFGDDRLAEVLAGIRHDPHAIVEGVVRAALAWQADEASDDIAVVSFAAT